MFVLPVYSVRDLGVIRCWRRTHLTAVARSCFAALRQIRSVRRAL